MKITALVTGVALLASLAQAGSVSAQQFVNPNLRGYPPRTRYGGDAELQRELGRIAQTIRAIQNDRHDDGGYRMRAIGDLERAEQELRRAIQWDRGHGGY
jgi:hypothetical protein